MKISNLLETQQDRDNLPRQNILSQDATVSRQTARWDTQNIFKNYFALVVSQIGGALFSFATVWIATRLYGTNGYGNIVAIIAGSQAIQLFTNWTNVALARYGVEEFVETGCIRKTFWSRTILFVPNLGIVAITAPFWIYWLLALLNLPSGAVSFIIFYFVSSAIWLHFQQALQAVKMPRLQGILIFFERVSVFLLIAFFGFVLKLSWIYAFCAFIFSGIFMSAIALWRIRLLVSWNIIFDKIWIKRLLAFSVPLIPYSITSFFCTNYLDAFFITKYLSKAELGIYSVGYQINGLLLQFLILVGTLLMPMFVTLRSNGQETYINKYLEEVLPSVMLLWGAFIPFFAIFTGILIPMIFGSQFSSLAVVIWVFMMGTTFNIALVIGYSPFATAASAVYISFPLAFTTAATNLIGNFILIPRWGLVGSAWSTSLSSIVAMLSIVLLIKWKFQFKTSFLFQSIIPASIGLSCYLILQNLVVSSFITLCFSLLFLLLNRKTLKKAFVFLPQIRRGTLV